MDRFFFTAGSLMAFIAVCLGAFGSHTLKNRITPEMLNIFEVGVRYHMYHALALLAVAWASSHWPERNFTAAGWSFIIGIIIFSGSLYILSIFGIRWLGAVTPLGGIAFLIGWAILVWSLGR